MTQILLNRFHISNPSDFIQFFPRKKKDMDENFNALSRRVSHYVNTGIWIDKNVVLNFTYENKLHISSLFNGLPIQRSFKRIEQGTFVPKNNWATNAFNGLTFINNFIKDPQHVGAVLPSFLPLAKEMVRKIPKYEPDANEKKRLILEVGPGTGSFTDKIITRLGKNDILHLVELDREFCALLTKKYAQLIIQGRLKIFNQSILDYPEQQKYDFMVSGLPLNSFPPLLVQQIFSKLEKLGKEGAKFSYFEYLLLPAIKGIFSEAIVQIQTIKDAFQKKHFLGNQDVLFNFPPAKVRHHEIRNIRTGALNL